MDCFPTSVRCIKHVTEVQDHSQENFSIVFGAMGHVDGPFGVWTDWFPSLQNWLSSLGLLKTTPLHLKEVGTGCLGI